MKEEYKAKLNTVLDVVYELEGLVQLALAKTSDNVTFLRLIKNKLATLNLAVDDLNVDEAEVIENNEAVENNDVVEDSAEKDDIVETVVDTVENTLENTVENAAEPDGLPDLSASSGFMRLKDKLEAFKTTMPDSVETVVSEDDVFEEAANAELITESDAEPVVEPVDDEVIAEVEEVEESEEQDEIKGFAVEPEPDDERTPVFTAAELRRSIESDESTRPSKSLTSCFSINDNFRFRRELFGNSAQAMKMALESVSEMQTMSDAEEFFYEELQWNPENPVVQEFMVIIDRFFQR